jgi:hypothetical protein
MKLSDLEDSDQVVTKDYLDMKLQVLKSELESIFLKHLIASERGQRLWIWGLYGLVIVSFFVRH